MKKSLLLFFVLGLFFGFNISFGGQLLPSGSITMVCPSWMTEGLYAKMNVNPYGLDDYCNKQSDGMQPCCESLKKSLIESDEYKEAVEKYEQKQEEIKKQKELEEKQKELEEKQLELEAKQKALEEENERLKQQQEKNSQIEESTSKIVEKLNKPDELPAMTKEVSKAKEELGTKAAIFDSLVPIFNKKDEKTKANVRALCKTFAQSKDAYTRNIGLYFGYLIQEQ